MPKGVVDIVFNFSGSTAIKAQIDAYKADLPKCYINGFNTVPVVLNIPGYQSFFGIRLNPVAIQPLFGIRTGELINRSLDLFLINKTIESLWYRLAGLNSFSERVNVIIQWFCNQQIKPDFRDEMLKDFFYNENETEKSVLSLSKELMISGRHLSRKIVALTGMNTEEVLLYKKYLRAQRLIHETDSSLTEIAYACNFYDQSHFIKTFKSYTKLTPGEYRKTKSLLPGHIFQ